MDLSTRLTKALDFIEDTLEEAVNLADVAKIAGYSHSHFTRTFEILFGISLDEYAVRRRLSRAIVDLGARGDAVADVAARYGWPSVAAFEDAFRGHFGISPSDPRMRDLRLETWPPLRSPQTRGQADVSGCTIVAKPRFCARGFMITTTGEQNQRDQVIPAFWQRILRSDALRDLIARSGSVELLGLCWDYNPLDSSFAYAIAVESPHDSPHYQADTGVCVLVPAATYAVFPLASAQPDAVQSLWKAIYSEWFPDSGYEHAGTPEFETFLIPRDGAPSAQGDYPSPAIWVPIRPSAV